MWPIWKKRNFDIVSGIDADGSAPFEVYAGMAFIYSGKAYDDNSGELLVQVNDLIAGRLYQELPISLTAMGFKYNLHITEQVEVDWNDGHSSDYETLLMDWSYDDSFNASDTPILSCPIRDTYDTRMPVFVTVARGTQIFVKRGSGSDVGYTSTGAANFVLPRNGEGRWRVHNNFGQSFIYDRKDTCRRYALYYVNAYGGWDALLLRRTHTEEDTYDRSKYRRFMQDNDLPINARGTMVWRNAITKRYTFHTDTLTDDEASRMHHLLGSNLVYLYDMEKGLFIPVTIAANACTYKTFINQGRKRVTYDIAVDVALEMERR